MSDFWFLTCDDTIVSPIDGLQSPSHMVELQICFHFDKNLTNGCWQKFQWTSHDYLCPVLASLSIVQHAIALQVPTSDPLEVYEWTQNNKSYCTYIYLQSMELIVIMQGLVVATHLDPSHYLRQPNHLHCIDCHSNQVTHVALSEGNALVNQIAHKL